MIRTSRVAADRPRMIPRTLTIPSWLPRMKSERTPGFGCDARSIASFESMAGPSRGTGKRFSAVTEAGFPTIRKTHKTARIYLGPGCGAGESMIERIDPPKPGTSPFSGAVVAGPFVFVSGQVGTDPRTGTTPSGYEHERSRDEDRKSTRLNSSHTVISYAVFCLKKKKDRDTKQT